MILGIRIQPRNTRIDMDKICFLLDSNVIIDTFNGKRNLLEFLDNFPNCEVYINPIVEIEVLAKPDITEQEETEIRVLLDSFKWTEIDKPTREIAIKIRRAKELRLPDALIAASAINLNATILSNDPHLQDYQYHGFSVKSFV